MKKCPFCAEEIQDEAIVCRYCNRSLAEPRRLPPRSRGPRPLDVLFVGATVFMLILFRASVWLNYERLALRSDLDRPVWDNLMPLMFNTMFVVDVVVWIAALLSVSVVVGLFTRWAPPGWLWMILGVLLFIHPVIAIMVNSDALAVFGLTGSMIGASVFLLGGLVRQMTTGPSSGAPTAGERATE